MCTPYWIYIELLYDIDERWTNGGFINGSRTIILVRSWTFCSIFGIDFTFERLKCGLVSDLKGLASLRSSNLLIQKIKGKFQVLFYLMYFYLLEIFRCITKNLNIVFPQVHIYWMYKAIDQALWCFERGLCPAVDCKGLMMMYTQNCPTPIS